MKERVRGRQGSLYFLSLFCCREGPLAANRELTSKTRRLVVTVLIFISTVGEIVLKDSNNFLQFKESCKLLDSAYAKQFLSISQTASYLLPLCLTPLLRCHVNSLF